MRLSDGLAAAYAYGLSLASFWTDGPPRPVSATFAVTNRCNIRCAYCSFPFLDPRELGLEEVSRLLERLRRLGALRLGLTGGEPLLRPDFGAIARLAKGLGFYLTVNTNLLLYRRDPSALDPADLVFTSLDGGPEAHRRARGPGSWDGVLDAVGELRRRGKPVVAICVVTGENLDEAPGLLDEAEARGFRVHFQPRCTGAEIVRGAPSEEEDGERLRSFWRDRLEDKRAGRPVASSTGYLERLSTWADFRVSAYYDPEKRCAAGRGFLFIDPLGRASPCPYTQGKVPPVDLLREDWRTAFGGKTPCTSCSVGPMVEFNLLYERPLAAGLEAARSYGL